MVYGGPLALFQLGRLKEAGRALNLAIKHWPLVAAELLKARHRKPQGTNERYVSLGGADQAYWYWRRQGKYWAETPGALEFLRKGLPGGKWRT